MLCGSVQIHPASTNLRYWTGSLLLLFEEEEEPEEDEE
jgi:hypothetical protein